MNARLGALGRAVRPAAWLLLAAMVPAVLTATLHPRRPAFVTPENVPEITVATASGWRDTLFVDARREADFRRGCVPGAVPLNEDRWEVLLPGFIGRWAPGRKVVVYCDSQKCDASQAVARRLRRELRINDVFVLKGGWAAWQAAQK